MLDNEFPVVFPSRNYVRVRRNALGNILEGIDQRSQAWLAECVLLSIINGVGRGVGQSGQLDMSEEEDQEEPTKDEEGNSSSLNRDILSTKNTQSKPEDKNGERSVQLQFLLNDEKCLDSAVNLESPSSLVKSYSQTFSSFIMTRRNALHSLMENLNANELTKLKQIYLFQMALEQQENKDQSSAGVIAGQPRQLGNLLPSSYGKLAAHV